MLIVLHVHIEDLIVQVWPGDVKKASPSAYLLKRLSIIFWFVLFTCTMKYHTQASWTSLVQCMIVQKRKRKSSAIAKDILTIAVSPIQDEKRVARHEVIPQSSNAFFFVATGTGLHIGDSKRRPQQLNHKVIPGGITKIFLQVAFSRFNDEPL